MTITEARFQAFREEYPDLPFAICEALLGNVVVGNLRLEHCDVIARGILRRMAELSPNYSI